MDKSLHINSIIETSSCRSARILVSVSCLLFIAIAFVSPSDRNPRRGRRLAVTPATDRVYRLKMQVRLFHSLPDYLLPALGYSRCKKMVSICVSAGNDLPQIKVFPLIFSIICTKRHCGTEDNGWISQFFVRMFYLTLSHLTCKCHAGKYPYCDGGRGMPMVEYDESVIFFVSIGMMSRFLERFYLLPALEFSRFIKSCGQKMQAYLGEHIKAADKWKTIASWCRGVESSSAQHEGLGELIPINMWLIL